MVDTWVTTLSIPWPDMSLIVTRIYSVMVNTDDSHASNGARQRVDCLFWVHESVLSSEERFVRQTRM